MKDNTHYISIPRLEYEEREEYYKSIDELINEVKNSEDALLYFRDPSLLLTADTFDGHFSMSTIKLPRIIYKGDREDIKLIENDIDSVREELQNHNKMCSDLRKNYNEIRRMYHKNRVEKTKSKKDKTSTFLERFLLILLGFLLGLIIFKLSTY